MGRRRAARYLLRHALRRQWLKTIASAGALVNHKVYDLFGRVTSESDAAAAADVNLWLHRPAVGHQHSLAE